MNSSNLIYTLDSYKHLHGDMMPEGTEHTFAYLEARRGAMYDYTIFYGLQPQLKHWLVGPVVTKAKIDEAEPLLREHFKHSGDVWSRAKWDYIVDKHGGHLPVRLRAVKEGTKVPISNALFTLESTDSNACWLPQALETLLQQVWYPTTVCTRSHVIVNLIRRYFKQTADDSVQWLVDYFLHDFGQRATAGMEQAAWGGSAHLVNSRGTDSVMGMRFAIDEYYAKLDGLAYSVPASEHSVATALGPNGEFDVVRRLITTYPKGILSVVSDSYDIERAIKVYCTDLKPLIMAREGKFVVRPDSPRWEGDTAAAQVLWIAQQLWAAFGGATNTKGYRVLDQHVGIIYGDGLTETDIEDILKTLVKAGFSAETCVFGCGGYLLDKLNRDTMRFAVKSSAQCRNGIWYDIYKEPSDKSKASKRGRLALAHYENSDWVTVPESLVLPQDNKLELVFENGVLLRDQTFDEVRALAAQA